MERLIPPQDDRLDLARFESRKRSHLEISLDPRMQAAEAAAFDRVVLEHDALPELDFADVDLTTPFLTGRARRALATPFFVSGMTAGHASARVVNERLARVCAARGWIFGVGSQRRELDESRPPIDAWSDLATAAPGLVALGNLGLAQAARAAPERIRRLAANVGAAAFCIHLNPLQEVLQPEGTPQFAGGLAALRKLAKSAGVPIVVKETGCGLSPATLRKLAGLPLAAVDVAGLGGTHWGRIEGARAALEGDAIRARAAETFRGWGVSTVDSVRAAAAVLPKRTEIWASGGVRSGLDAAKLVALGATRVGFAKPALEAALAGEAALDRWMATIEFEFRAALFCAGRASPAELRGSPIGAAGATKKPARKNAARKAPRRRGRGRG